MLRTIPLIILVILLSVSTMVFSDAPPPPSPPDEIFNYTRYTNLTNIISWYYNEWWGSISWAVVFLIPASIFIKSRSISLAITSLVLLMSIIGVGATGYAKYIALLGIAFGLAVIVYRVFYNPEKQIGEA